MPNLVRYEQLSFADLEGEAGESYREFVEKFKQKKTTDDCYTPEPIYEVVLKYCEERYGIKKENVLRPFFPGGDYERETYESNSVVIDNPPFSILTKIIKFYSNNGIRFFLFAPYLTVFSTAGSQNVTAIVCDAKITYENGAVVNTCFITNLEEEYIARSDFELSEAIKNACRKLTKERKKELPKYVYDIHVLTSTMLGYLSAHGVNYALKKADALFIRNLDSQKEKKKALFGGGFLISAKAAAEKAAAEKAAAAKAAAEKAAAEKAAAEKAERYCWELSEREKMIVKRLGEGDSRND